MGAISALKSLQNQFPALYICSYDQDVQRIMRSSDAALKNIKDYTTYDIVICAGYKNIILPEELEQTDFINIHYSKLPKYRGLHSVAWAILNDEKTIAASIHKMSQDIDAGDILAEYDLPLGDKNSAQLLLRQPSGEKSWENNL